MQKEYTLIVNHYPYRVLESGAGYPLIWIHGMFHSPAIEDKFSVVDFHQLSSAFRLIRIELPGHGKSPVIRDENRLTWSSLGEDIKQLVEVLHGGEYAIGGFSQGGGIAAHVSIRDPKVKGLIFAMLPMVWESRESLRNTYRKLCKALETQTGSKVLERLFSLTKYPPEQLGWSETLSSEISEQMLLPGPESYSYVLKGAILSDLPFESEILTSGRPIIAAAWENDLNHPISVYHEIRSRLNPVSSVLLQQKSGIGELSRTIIECLCKKM